MRCASGPPVYENIHEIQLALIRLGLVSLGIPIKWPLRFISMSQCILRSTTGMHCCRGKINLLGLVIPANPLESCQFQGRPL
ncbi:unnamed protein product [Nezara viridula]|uniref:Uncharacterized protein n=1 Tax=Nezara viridula TaxID=85310 RepID=A0A9P0EBT4_NEZVI|nr:unnamed protein product [Nezara viridula]